MKNQIYLYLAIFGVLSTIFIWMFYKNDNKFLEKRYDIDVKKYQDSLNSVREQFNDANYFSLENNQNAKDYLEKTVSEEFYPATKVIEKVKELLLKENDNVLGNKYVEFPKMGEQKFIINRIKVINHRWIIADFSNGTLWGEIYLRYFIEEDNSITFEVKDSFLYPN
jgi:hypothetical protein